MNADQLRELLAAVRDGRTTIDEASERLARLPVESLGFACLDHHRAIRCGFPEVILGSGKTTRQIVKIFDALAAHGNNVLATRVRTKQAKAVLKRHRDAAYHNTARCITLRQRPAAAATGLVAIVSAGTSDLPVAEEARITAEIMDSPTQMFYDVGVAGLHRLLLREAELRKARVVVVVAGMEGALMSVVGGLIEAPVIGVPTSVGYGASFNGLAPLLTMLNSCATGTAVVNIDNGFGAGYLAAVINRIGHDASHDQAAQPATRAPAPAKSDEDRECNSLPHTPQSAVKHPGLNSLDEVEVSRMAEESPSVAAHEDVTS